MWPSGYDPNRNDDNLSNLYRIYPDSDEYDVDEVLPLEAFRPSLEEERWTVVGNPHRTKCYDTKLDCDQLKSTRDQLDHSGLCCKQLDHIDWIKPKYDSDNYLSDEPNTEHDVQITADSDTKSAVLPASWDEVAQVHNAPSSGNEDDQSHQIRKEPDYMKGNRIFRRRPNVIAVESRNSASSPIIQSENMAPIPHVSVDDNDLIKYASGGMSPEQPDISPTQCQASVVEPVYLLRVAPVENEPGHTMQWPDIKSDGVVIDGIMPEPEMFPVGSVRGGGGGGRG